MSKNIARQGDNHGIMLNSPDKLLGLNSREQEEFSEKKEVVIKKKRVILLISLPGII